MAAARSIGTPGALTRMISPPSEARRGQPTAVLDWLQLLLLLLLVGAMIAEAEEQPKEQREVPVLPICRVAT